MSCHLLQIRSCILLVTHSLSRAIRRNIIIPILLLSLLLSACGSEKHEFTAAELPEQATAYNITGIDGELQPFQLSDHLGKYILLNFGYTFCPDVCPFTLVDLQKTYSQLLEQDTDLASKLSVVFVTVDPERDTIDKLGAYVNAFHNDFYGVRIEEETEFTRMMDAYSVVVSRRYEPGTDGETRYLVDHTAGIYVIDPEGKVNFFFKYGTQSDKIFADISYMLKG